MEGLESSSSFLRDMYPFVDDEQTPLPRAWSPADKCPFLGLSQGNLRVTYRGQGKNHKDAGAVRTAEPIPATCGVYYYEVTIVSKGRDGYMGIGLCHKDVSMLRLPGWENFSYGYHGDDGNSFCSSGNGASYGPTFGSGDVVGCGLNLVDGTAFYTKNGHHLGTAFRDLPAQLFPSVGLQTPGEVLDTNFGQRPFLYDVRQDILLAQLRVRAVIQRFPLLPTKKETCDKLISSYLIHHGYCKAAEAFDKATGQSSAQNAKAVRHRQKMQQLVLSGRLGEAIEAVGAAHPGLLQRRPQLLFLLHVQHLTELIASPEPVASALPRPSLTSAHLEPRDPGSPAVVPRRLSRHASPSALASTSANNGAAEEDVEMGSSSNGAEHANGAASRDANMDLSDGEKNGSSNGAGNGTLTHPGAVPTPPVFNIPSAPLPGNLDGILSFGKELRLFYEEHLEDKHPAAEKYARMMNDVFSLLCYPDPTKGPLSHLLRPEQREPVAASLNSAILEEEGFPGRPALETLLAHAARLREQLATHLKGSAAFASPLPPPRPSAE